MTEKAPLTPTAVGKPEEHSFDDKKREASRPEREISSEETTRGIKETEALLGRYKNFLTTFAKDASLTYHAGDAFMIDTESGRIYNDARWFLERDMSPDQILWAHLHEITHFRDLVEDKEGNEARLSHEVEKARHTGVMIMEKWKSVLPPEHPLHAQLEKQTPLGKKTGTMLNSTELTGFKFHHTFFNILDDIWVNASVARRAPRFAPDKKSGEEIERLYREKLFVQTDYTKLPRHLQFMYTFLRESMVPGEKVTVSPEVAMYLERPVVYKDKTYFLKDIISVYIKPRTHTDTSMSARDAAILKTIEPIFDELLEQDIADWNPELPQPPEKREGSQNGETKPQEEANENEQETSSGDPFEGAYEEFEQNNLDQFKEGEMDALAEKQRSEQEKPPQKEPEKKTFDEIQAELDKKWRERNIVNEATWNEFRKTEAEIDPYLAELSRLWRHIVYGKSETQDRTLRGHFATGSTLDVQRAIDEFPRIEQGQTYDARVMKRMQPEGTTTQLKPELIRVRLLADVSGSMVQGGRLEALKRAYVLLLSSLNEFNTYLNMSRSTTGSKLKVETEVVAFGERARVLKPLESSMENTDARASIIRSFEGLLASDHNTKNGEAYELITNSLTEEDRKNITDKKALELLFEITDGGSMDSYMAKTKVEELTSLGAVVRGFQIGTPGYAEREIFNSIWNSSGGEPMGKFIGNNLSNLLPALTELLREHLSQVEL